MFKIYYIFTDTIISVMCSTSTLAQVPQTSCHSISALEKYNLMKATSTLSVVWAIVFL